jgi:hypothetical protein
VLHRDIKPANILLRPNGAPVLVDFGSVRSVFMTGAESGSTVVGTYGYMPFEQFMGQATPASDLYALGATILHALTGRPPADFLLDGSRIAVPDPLPEPASLRPVLVRLLEPAAADRYQSAREVREALLAPVSSVSLVPAPVSGRPLPAPASAALPVRWQELEPVPRSLTGSTRTLLKRLAPGTWHMMATDHKPTEPLGVGFYLLMGFFSVLTAGVMPIIFAIVASERRRRYRRFLQLGLPARATILDTRSTKLPFDEEMIEVRYEFEADGRRYRGACPMLPAVSKTWQPGDEIQVLYLPDEDHDSVIISG